MSKIDKDHQMDTNTYSTAKTGIPAANDRALYTALNEVEVAANQTNQLIELAVEQMMGVHRSDLDSSSAAHMTSADTLVSVARGTSKNVADQISGLFPLLRNRPSEQEATAPVQQIVGCVIGASATSIVVGMDRFKEFSMNELLTFLNAVLLARHALSGIVNQPRFFTGPRKNVTYNHAGEATEELLEFLDGIQTIICKTALDAVPQDKDEMRKRAFVLLKAEIDAEGEIFEIADLVAKLQPELQVEGAAQ